MERATKQKKSIKDLEDVNKIRKKEMDQIFGGNSKGDKKRNKFSFGSWFSPCEGDIPQ